MGQIRTPSLYEKIKTALGRMRVESGDVRSVRRYQPEKHYMRGPGPKTQAKRQGHPQTDSL